MKYVVGVDYGSDSVRSVLVSEEGEEIASSVHYYQRWKEGKFCEPSKQQFRQHPLDYLEGLETTLKEVIGKLPESERGNVKAISVDTTGSTPCAVNAEGTPLALTPGFEENPNAMFVLWKDHTAIKEANEINELARSWGGPDYTKYVGGIYSSEWFWAKMLHVLRDDESIQDAAYSWVEACDWIPYALTGEKDVTKMKRSRCAAGHKAMWHEEFDGLPSEEFLTKLDPLLAGVRGRLYEDTYTSDVAAGTLSAEWAEKLGISEEVVIGVGAFDAHMGAVGGNIQPNYLVRVMGTSTCDMIISPEEEVGDNLVKGICGQVDGSIIPGYIGLEAGQSGFGDVLAWFKNVLMGPFKDAVMASKVISDDKKAALIEEAEGSMLARLSEQAMAIEEDTGITALDWVNGRRTPDANQMLKAAIEGMDLGSDAPRIFKALVEGICFGSKLIVDRFRDEGVRIDGVIGMGGVAKKSPFMMQTLANVLDMPIKVSESLQTCALGASVFAATAAGMFESVDVARESMASGFESEFKPQPEEVEAYKAVYDRYKSFAVVMEERIMKNA